MTETAATEQRPDRGLRRYERLGFDGFLICAAVVLMECVAEAAGTPQGFLTSLMHLPGNLQAALVVGGVASIVLGTSARDDRRVRVAALLALLGSVGSLVFTIGVIVMMALVTKTFD